MNALLARAMGKDGLNLESVGLDRDTLDFLLARGIAVMEDEAPRSPSASCELGSIARDPTTFEHFGDVREDAPLVPNSDVHPLGSPDAPSCYERVQRELGLGPEALLVRDPRSGFLSPTELEGELSEEWRAIQAGHRVVGDLSASTRRAFAAARLLVPNDSDRAGVAYLKAAQDALQARGFAILRDIVPPAFAQVLRSYSRTLVAEGVLLPDPQFARRLVFHNEPVMQAVHKALEPTMSAITARDFEPCKSSYAFFATYLRGATLSRHTDRPQCRWNVSLPLSAQPHLSREEQWPIFIETPDGQPHEVRLGLCDGLLYPGMTLPHWREELTVADQLSVCFFHFVDGSFSGRLV
jgi:hypothetical protein